jgi:cob(I)alamin adenosyltransferase
MTIKNRKGLIIVYTGNGKGKTTAALGMLLRAWGQDMKVGVMQFVKSPNSICGEHRALSRMGIEVITLGAGFTWVGTNLEKNQTCSRELWNTVKEKIKSGKYDMLILDEFTYPLKLGWLQMDEVREVLRDRPFNLHIIITGREAPQELVGLADAVMEVRSVKHHLEKRIPAQPGIEF